MDATRKIICGRAGFFAFPAILKFVFLVCCLFSYFIKGKTFVVGGAMLFSFHKKFAAL